MISRSWKFVVLEFKLSVTLYTRFVWQCWMYWYRDRETSYPRWLVNSSRQWDVCKSPGFPSNRVAAGQVDPPAVRITMVCSLFACCLSASEAFLFLSGAVCWVFSNAYTKEEHLLVFSWLVIGEGPELLDAEVRSSIVPLRWGTCRRSKSLSLRPKQRTCLTQDLHLCARRTFHWLCGAFFSQNQPRVLRKWAMVSYAKDLWRLWQDVTQDWRPGWSWRKIMIFWRSI